jgi:hypothetical protein
MSNLEFKLKECVNFMSAVPVVERSLDNITNNEIDGFTARMTKHDFVI